MWIFNILSDDNNIKKAIFESSKYFDLFLFFFIFFWGGGISFKENVHSKGIIHQKI